MFMGMLPTWDLPVSWLTVPPRLATSCFRSLFCCFKVSHNCLFCLMFCWAAS